MINGVIILGLNVCLNVYELPSNLALPLILLIVYFYVQSKPIRKNNRINYFVVFPLFQHSIEKSSIRPKGYELFTKILVLVRKDLKTLPNC